jgi:hypothetical protein
VKSRATVAIPLHDRVLFVSSLNCAEFSRWLSEVAQTFDPISGSQLLAGGRGSESGGLLARFESGIAPACESGGWGALRSFGIRLLAAWVIVFSFPRGQDDRASPRLFVGIARYSIRLERMAWLKFTTPRSNMPVSLVRSPPPWLPLPVLFLHCRGPALPRGLPRVRVCESQLLDTGGSLECGLNIASHACAVDFEECYQKLSCLVLNEEQSTDETHEDCQPAIGELTQAAQPR